MTSQDPVIERDFRQHHQVLWDLSYRMTGSAADADDVVQETFVRALTQPPRTDLPLLPWLVKVSLNAARDVLRRRKRRGYVGPWLPDPIELEPAAGTPPADVRYDHLESASFAFLLALEALTARQRAVLLLRDVFDYSVRETAEALGVSEGAVKTLHHRARRGLEDYDRGRTPSGTDHAERARVALARLMTAVVAGDVAGVEELLAADVELLTDAGGEFLAARQPIRGRDKVARGFVALSRKTPNTVGEARPVNGLPGLVVRDLAPPPRHAASFVISLDLDASGSVRRVYIVMASRKLVRIRPV